MAAGAGAAGGSTVETVCGRGCRGDSQSGRFCPRAGFFEAAVLSAKAVGGALPGSVGRTPLRGREGSRELSMTRRAARPKVMRAGVRVEVGRPLSATADSGGWPARPARLGAATSRRRPLSTVTRTARSEIKRLRGGKAAAEAVGEARSESSEPESESVRGHGAAGDSDSDHYSLVAPPWSQP